MLELTIEPATTPVSLNEVEQHSRLFGDSTEDVLVDMLIMAATEAVEKETGLALINRTPKLTLDSFAPKILLPVAPVISISSVKYRNTTGTQITLPSDQYQLLDKLEAPAVAPAYATVWPVTSDAPEAVEITFVAGYGAAGSDVPANLRLAVLKLVAAFYEYRESIGSANMADMPAGVRELIQNDRRWKL